MGLSNIILSLFLCIAAWGGWRVEGLPRPDDRTGHLSYPNTGVGVERLLGLGPVLPYPYFQKPRHRYPVYDREGKGYLAYGFGDQKIFRYTKFDKIEGLH